VQSFEDSMSNVQFGLDQHYSVQTSIRQLFRMPFQSLSGWSSQTATLFFLPQAFITSVFSSLFSEL
jgi:hypothetical protein